MAETRSLTDRELAEALATASVDKAVLVETYRRFLPKMIVRAARVLGDSAGYAEDIAQATIAKLILKGTLGRLQDPGSLGSYLLTAAHRAALDLLRAIGREIPTDGVGDKENWIDEAPDGAEMRERLDAVLSALRPEDQELIRWRFFEELHLDEIAEKKGLTYAAAGQRLSRALAHARDAAGVRPRKV